MATKSAQFFTVLGRYVNRQVVLPLVLAIACVPHAMASSSPDAADVSIEIFDSNEFETFTARRDGLPYTFYANVEVLSGAPNMSGDLYFGILEPSGKVSYTWREQGESYQLRRGMVPLTEDVDLRDPHSVSTAQIAGQQLTFAFDQTTSAGIYFVFLLLVGADQDPAETRNWLKISAVPLIVN